MSENLVVMKSMRQRALEGWLCLIMPLLLSGGIRLIAPGWALLGGALGFASYLLIPGIGAAIVNRLPGGERVTIDERARRTYETLFAQSPARMILWMAFGYISWISAPLLAIVDFHHRTIVVLVAGLAIVVGALSALMAFYAMRQSYRRLSDAVREELPLQTLWEWLPDYLPVHYGCAFGTLAVGYVLGRLCGPPFGIILFGASYFASTALEGFIRSRLKSRKRPLLWTQLRFPAALGLSVLQLGLPFATYAALVPGIMGYPGWFVALIFGGGGLVFGTVLALLMWVTANLSVAGARRTGS